VLLSGLTPRPYLPICILVAFTTPITFYLYALFAKHWASLDGEKKPIAKHPATVLLIVGVILGLTNILGPIAAIPRCKPVPAGVAAS